MSTLKKKRATKKTAVKKTAGKRPYTRRASPTTKGNARRVVITRNRRGADKPLYVQGYGDYDIAGKIGSMVPAHEPNLGSKIGSFLGGKLHDLVSSITGFGDYEIDQNSVMTGGLSPPEVMNTTNHGGVVVRHREYIGDIGATINFTNTSFALNPGLSTTFPWLASVADAYEEYRWRGLLFEFKSLSSDSVLSASTSSALGSVIMATEYNVLNPPFADKKVMENYDKANSNKPSCSFIHPVECAISQTPVDKLFVRNTSVPTGADARLYDLGSFQIATVGMQAASGIAGELWATYEVEFFKPRYSIGGGSGPGDAGAMDHFILGTVTNANPLGTTSVRSAQSTLGGTITGGGTYNFPPAVTDGNFMIIWRVVGGSVVLVTPSVSSSGMTGLGLINNNSGNTVFVPLNGATSTSVMVESFWTVLTTSTWSLGNAGTLPTAVTFGDLYVVQIPTPMNYLRRRLKYLNVRGVYEETNTKALENHKAMLINPSRWEMVEDVSESSEDSETDQIETGIDIDEFRQFEQFKKFMAMQKVAETSNKRNSL